MRVVQPSSSSFSTTREDEPTGATLVMMYAIGLLKRPWSSTPFAIGIGWVLPPVVYCAPNPIVASNEPRRVGIDRHGRLVTISWFRGNHIAHPGLLFLVFRQKKT